MACKKRLECRKWMRNGDSACHGCTDQEENKNPEAGGEGGRERLFPLDFTCPKCGDCMSLYADGDGEVTCGVCGYSGPLSEFDDSVVEPDDEREPAQLYMCPECKGYACLRSIDGEVTCGECGHHGPPSEFEVVLNAGSEPDGEEDEEAFGIPALEPDEVDAIHDSMTEAEREQCCESGNEAIASIDEALDYTGRHLASLDEDCEDGGYRDGVKAALEELRKARRLLARLLEEYPSF